MQKLYVLGDAKAMALTVSSTGRTARLFIDGAELGAQAPNALVALDTQGVQLLRDWLEAWLATATAARPTA